jgi:hypothetical protein
MVSLSIFTGSLFQGAKLPDITGTSNCVEGLSLVATLRVLTICPRRCQEPNGVYGGTSRHAGSLGAELAAIRTR